MPKSKLTGGAAPIRYDFARMLSRHNGGTMLPSADLTRVFKELAVVRTRIVRDNKATGAHAFLNLAERADDVRAVTSLAANVRRHFRTLIVIGIGGSDLGARMLVESLQKRGQGMEIRFIGNTDPDEVDAALAGLDWTRTAVNVVSKSGETVEPIALFLAVRERLIRAVGKMSHIDHVIVTTDAEKGALRELARRYGYRHLAVPADIGGRFSVLTAVGLFPAACAGIKPKELLAGYASMIAEFVKAAPRANGPLLWAGLQHDAYARRFQHITVLMPYASRLKSFAFWFRQLWAESLGKRLDRAGQEKFHGLTPVAALGAVDQHSQVQLYNEGTFDKVITFIESSHFATDVRLPKAEADLKSCARVGGHRLGDILRMEREATALALFEAARPNGTLHIQSTNAQAVGALIAFFQCATAAAAELLDVNAYDQPGVEAGKQALYRLLDE